MSAVRDYARELLTAFLLTLTLLGATTQDVLLGALAIAAVVGLVAGLGAHANPALTLAAVVARRLPAADLLPYWAAQLVGALVGAALARWLVDAPDLDPLQGLDTLVLLVVLTLFALVLGFVVLHGDDSAVPAGPAGPSTPALTFGAGTGLAAGLAVLAAAALVDPLAAAAFNPAAAFGQVVAGVTGWSTIWVYVVGCPAGAAVGGLLARTLSGQPRSRSG